MFQLLANGNRIVLNASFTPRQWSVGGNVRARVVRAFGSDAWQVVQDRKREPNAFELQGIVFDPSERANVLATLQELRSVAGSVTRVYHVVDGVDVAYLEVQRGVPPVEEIVDPLMVRVTLAFLPSELVWRDASTDVAGVI